MKSKNAKINKNIMLFYKLLNNFLLAFFKFVILKNSLSLKK